MRKKKIYTHIIIVIGFIGILVSCETRENFFPYEDFAGKQVRADSLKRDSILLNNHAPVCEPTAKAGMSEIDEYIITANAKDAEWDTIVLYEYLIDGVILYNEEGYEVAEPSFPCVNAGYAAYMGKYIKGTEEESISHIFQDKGSHTVSTRAKDSKGKWGIWTTIEINN